MRQFECYLCGKVYETATEPIMHYDQSEMDENGDVSLCDWCVEDAQNKAKEMGVESHKKL